MSNEIALIQPPPMPKLASLDALAPEEQDTVLRRVENAKAEATRAAYESDWKSFSRYAAEHKDAITLPADPGLICGYLSHLADLKRRSSSIGRHMAAIAHFHRQAGYDPGPTSHPSVRAIMQSIRREIGTASQQKTALTASLVLRVLAHCGNTAKDIRDKAMIAVGFAAALRRSEVVGVDAEHLSWTTEGVRLLIPRSKTDQEGKGQEIAIPNGVYIKPVELLRHWLDVSGITTGPIFRPVARGQWLVHGRLADDAYVRMIKRRCMAAGINPTTFSGHSLRSGYVTTAIEAKAELTKVTEVTRHKSLDMLLVYSRRANLFSDHSGGSFL